MPKVSCNYQVNDRMRFYFSPDGVYVSDNFQALQNYRECEEIVSALASVTITQIFCELSGRTPYGGGLLKVQTYEVANLPIVNPKLIVNEHQRVLTCFRCLASRPIRSIFEELGFQLCRQRKCEHPEHPYEFVKPEELTLGRIQQSSPDRFELDRVVFDVLGLTDEERLEVYKAVAELVKTRLVKAKSV